MNIPFQDVLDFHGCYCLDIAMGYRVALALQREMQEHLANPKEVIAQIGNATCATDAIQKMLGCTSGKRNLYFMNTGKPVYILQNNRTGKAVRAYVHFWEEFDQSKLAMLKSKTKSVQATDKDRRDLQLFLDQSIEHILNADEELLFRLRRLELDPLPMIGKFETQACSCCGEHAKNEETTVLEGKIYCSECR